MAVIYKAPKKEKEKSSFVNQGETTYNQPKSSPLSSRVSKKKRKNKKEIYHDIARKIHGTAGLSVEPRGVRFVDKDQDEETLVVLRRHPVTNMPWVVMTLVMFFIISPAIRFNWLAFFPSSLQAVVVYSWFVIALVVAWASFLSWYFNVSIISSKRVIDIDLHDLIYREVSDANLDKIEDVTHNMGGLLGIIFNFGDIYIQTAGAKPQIEFLKVPRPAEVATTLRKLREVAEK